MQSCSCMTPLVSEVYLLYESLANARFYVTVCVVVRSCCFKLSSFSDNFLIRQSVRSLFKH